VPSEEDQKVLRLVSCSWMVALKRLPLIIGALATLATRLREYTFEWTHLGGGDGWDSITAYAQSRLGEITNVKFKFAGSMDNQAVLSYYRASQIDLFLSASEWEGLPVSMMEAAAHGIPIIATDVGGISEIVMDGRNGFLVPRDVSPAGFASAIEKFARLPAAQKRKFRQTSREMWSERFSACGNFSNWVGELSLH